MPDKFGIPAIPAPGDTVRLYNVLIEQRAQLIRWINELTSRIAALAAAPGGLSPPVLLSQLELIPGLSVLGRNVNSPGVIAPIIAAVDGTVLQRLGLTVGFFGLSGGQLADGSIDYVKIVPQPASTLLGRGDAGFGPPEVITPGIGLLISGTTLDVIFPPFPPLSIPNNFVTNAMLRDSVALSVMGRSVNSPGDPGDIPTTLNSNAVLRELAGVVGWGLLTNANLAAAAGITLGQLANGAPLSVVGRSANSIGVHADIPAIFNSNAVLMENGGSLAWSLLGSANITPGGISRASLSAGLALSVMGRSVNTNGPVADIQAILNSNAVLRESAGVLGWGLVGQNNLANNAVGNAQFRGAFALSVVGNAANAVGNVADITATAASNAVLMELGSALVWGLLTNANIAAAAGIAKTKLENSAATSVVGRATNTAGPVADIVAASGGSGVLKENGAGALFFGLINTNNIASNALIPTSKLANSAARSVLGVPGGVAAPPSDIVSTADGQILTRKAGVVGWTAAPTTYTMYQRVYDSPAFWGEATVGTPTLALTSPTTFNQTSGNNHFVGFLMGDAKISWLRFGFTVPADHQVGTGFTPRICFILQSAPAAGNVVELSIVSTLFNDNDNLAAGTGVFGTTNVVITGYAASDYVIVDLNAIGAGLTPGQYYQGVIQRDARGAADTYADLIAVSWISFRGAKVAV